LCEAVKVTVKGVFDEERFRFGGVFGGFAADEDVLEECGFQFVVDGDDAAVLAFCFATEGADFAADFGVLLEARLEIYAVGFVDDFVVEVDVDFVEKIIVEWVVDVDVAEVEVGALALSRASFQE
jgi:hypothetical protein